MTWLSVTAALVMLMQAGFCCLETGLVRAKNSINVAIKNLVDFCISTIVFWVFGFGLMFGTSFHGLIGTSHFLPDQVSPQLLCFLFFQAVFCGTSTTIVSGAVAERMRFG
jgi:Amt family ammonium transporter